MQLTTNFNLNEFASKDGSSFPKDVIESLKELATNLQVIRDEIDSPIIISSGYRSKAHNKAIKGAKDSYHVKGMAADIKVKGWKPKDVANVIKLLMDKGIIKKGGLKAYPTFVHYDIRGYYATW